MAKHTPGPWCIEEPMGAETPWIVEANKQTYEWRCIAMVTCEDNESEIPVEEGRANARLIAAAPDLLEAAVIALNYIANTESEFSITLRGGDYLRAAIAKAEAA